MDLELAGKRALVTGASQGIGAACARALAAEGAEVVLSGRDRAALTALTEELVAEGRQATCVAGDITDETVVAALVPDGAEPDIFVHAAGHRFRYARLPFEDDADAARVFAVDHGAFAAIAKRALPGMMARRFGRIVAVTSLSSLVAGAGTSRYAAAKAATEAMVRSIAIDFGRYGITANAVAPGFVATARLEGRNVEDRRAVMEGATSVKRLGSAEEIAAPVVFLASPRAAYVTGATILVTGGLHLNNAW